MDANMPAKPTGFICMAYLNMLPATQVGFIKNLIRVPRRIVKGFVRCIGRTRDLLKMLFKAGEMFFSLGACRIFKIRPLGIKSGALDQLSKL